jgi:trimeric autotransporter adhesin
MTTPHIKSLGRSPLRLGFLVIHLALACSALSPTVRAVDPPPDGGYPGANTAEGEDALFSLTTGGYNTAIGFQALYNITDSYFNTANGAAALYSNTTGGANTAIGSNALFANTTGAANTATGSGVMVSNTTGSSNTADGFFALLNNTTGNGNTGTGDSALLSNTTGSNNTANGLHALFSNTTGDFNTAYGESALGQNSTGGANTAIGEDALVSNTDGNWNTATGTNALIISNGQFNTANGAGALENNTSGDNNIALGWEAGGNLTTGAYNIDIGNKGVAGESKTIRIGDVVATPYADGTHPAHTATYIAGIMGKTSSRGTPVFINANGKLGTATSSARFKDEIKPMDKASEAILALKPVTFRYKKELDPDATPQFGLVAEDVAKVNPDLVVRDAEGKVYTVRYEAVNAMLLNEFLKAHRTVQELKSTVAQQEMNFQATVAQQQKQIEALTTGLQKVSDQLELSKPAPQTVLNNQ